MPKAIIVAIALALLLSGCGAGTSTGKTRPTLAQATIAPGGPAMKLTSPAFDEGGLIPSRYTCDGDDVSPPLRITDLPPGTGALALVVDDPDAPMGTWDHWVEYDIPPLDVIPEDAGTIGTPGVNSWGRTGYGGPCPPSGVHRYFFTVYALDEPLGLPAGVDKATLLEAMRGHVLAEATLMGRYGR